MKSCPCPLTMCRRYGNCAECRDFHRRVNTPPYCDRMKGVRSGSGSGVNLMDYAACAG